MFARERLVVIGMSGSGKTTMARRLACCLQFAHGELDAMRWDADWTISPHFRQRVAVFLARESRWVCDGNASAIRELLWAQADTIVWLDYSFGYTLWRLLRRTVRRVAKRERLWADNRETASKAFFSRDSVLWWMITSYHKHRLRNMALMRGQRYAHLQWHHFRVPSAADRWLARIECSR